MISLIARFYIVRRSGLPVNHVLKKQKRKPMITQDINFKHYWDCPRPDLKQEWLRRKQSWFKPGHARKLGPAPPCRVGLI